MAWKWIRPDGADPVWEPAPWKCPLCAVKNTRGEKYCRICGLQKQNRCSSCRRNLDPDVRFCKYCGSPSVYFQAAVFDPRECELAREESRKLIARYRRHGITYVTEEAIYEYEQEQRYEHDL